MPTKEQMDEVAEHIGDVIGRNYIEGDGDQCSCWFQPEGGGAVGMALFQGEPIGTPEPFADLPSKAKAELLVNCVGWEGFSQGERADVINRVLEGEQSEFWMDGIQETSVLDPKTEQKISRFISENDIDGYLSWLGGDPEKTRERLEQVEAYDSNQGDVLDNPPIRPLTEQLINAVLLDAWPGNAAIIDFGIDSSDHLGALQYAIKYGEVTPHELDAAMGSGAKLTEIAQRGDNPYRDVVFKTSWDEMRLEPPDEPEPDEVKALFVEIRADEHAARVRDYGDASPPDKEKILFGKILHGTPSPEPRQEQKAQEKSRGDEGHEM